MVLPTYLGIKEAAKRIEQKCREPVTTDWLLQHASEGRLQLFALVRDEDVCILTGAKPFGTGRMNTPERAPMSVMSHEVFGGDRFPLDALDQMIRVVHPVGSRAPLEDVWASRLVANRNADIYTVAIDGERASIISRIYSNWRLHENGHIVGSAWRWKVSISDLYFLSEDIEQLIEANSSIAATSPKQPAEPTKTTATETKVGADDTAARKEAQPKLEAGEPFLQPKSKNSRAAVDQWVKWQAHQLVKATDNTFALAERIWEIADRWKYESERGPMTIASITKMLPPGLTGGRGKNKGIKAKK